jgi:hypothetical protein
MQLKQAIEYQIEATIGQLLRARNKMIAAKEQDDFDEIDLRLAAVVQHLEDIRFNWKTLIRSKND